MTICISAICNKNKQEHIVFTVDHMITTLNGEFEHPIKKYRKINKNTVGMIAGDTLLMDFFMDLEEYDSNYETLQKLIYNKFKEKRFEIIQNTILNTFFIDIEFIKENLNKQIDNMLMQEIYKGIISTKLKSAVLLIGFINNHAQISEIGDEGISNFNNINFHTIGSGAQQAQNTLLFQKHSSEDSLKTALYNVYKAKKNAEVKQGVGRETEIGYLNHKTMKILDEKNINILDNIYNLELEYGKTHSNLENLNI